MVKTLTNGQNGHGVRKVYHGVRKVYHGGRKVYHGVRKVYRGVRNNKTINVKIKTIK